MKTSFGLIIKRLKDEFNKTERHDDALSHTWVMGVSVRPVQKFGFLFHLNLATQLTGGISRGQTQSPSHVARVVLRTSSDGVTAEYVDGTEIYVLLDEQESSVSLVWTEKWAVGPPIFEGGPINSALSWLGECGEIVFIQLDDPFCQQT